MSRYRSYSYKIANDLLSEYGGCSYAEIDDLVSIGLLSLQTAIRAFDGGEGKFYPYWRAIARNNMLNYIMDLSYYVKGVGQIFLIPLNEIDNNTYAIASYSEDRAEILKGEIEKFLNAKINQISERDKYIFRLYLYENLTIKEIAKKVNLTYNTVRDIINRIRYRLIRHLFK